MDKDTVLIYSGGMDSTSALHIYKDIIAVAVSFNYGSKHNEMELKYAKLNCERLQIPHIVIDLRDSFRPLSNSSSLLDKSKNVPYGHYEDKSMRSTVVPFRNGIMLSYATAIAEARGLNHVMIGSHKGDNAVYPDCTPAFNTNFSEAMFNGTYNNVSLLAPFQDLTKHELALLGYIAGMRPEQTYSCYEGGLEHCGKCGTCVERQEAMDYVYSVLNSNDEAQAVVIDLIRNKLKD